MGRSVEYRREIHAGRIRRGREVGIAPLWRGSLNGWRYFCAARFTLDASAESPTFTDAERLQKGYRYALALTHHPADAEDLVHEAWLNLSRRYGRVENNAVLYTAVRNLFVDQCRRRKIVQFDSLDEAEGAELPALAESEPGVQGDLEALLATLRPVEREALFLHYYEGRTAEEISQMT